MALFARMRSLWRGVHRRDDFEHDMGEEFRQHVALRAADLERSGLTAAEALRQARIEFGSLEQHKHDARASRGLRRVDALRWSWLDVKLGARMLIRYPGLTLVGGVGLAVAIAVAAVAFTVISIVLDPQLPLDQGDRIVAIRNINVSSFSDQRQTHLHDLETWREGAPAIAAFAAYRTVDRNLITRDGRVEPVRVAEMTASGFRIARAAPLLGRYFVDADAWPTSPPSVIISSTVWQSRFASDPDVVGRTLQLGSVVHTIVGVMPEGFGFPVNNRLWTPLRLRPADFEPGNAPDVDVFGRLATGATIPSAHQQLSAIGQRLSTSHPETHGQVRAQVLPYPQSFLDADEAVWTLHLFQIAVTMLLVVIGTNVAILVYARTATRAGEITVRTALGASRSRIVTQFFAEAMVLSGLAAIAGLLGARSALGYLDAFLSRMGGEQIPFWMRFHVSFTTVIYVAGLAVLAAVIIGVIPALKATGRRVQANLQRLGVGGSGMRLGKVWTFLVVTQVAVTVALLPVVVGGAVAWLRWTLLQPKYSTGDFLTATVVLDRLEGPGAIAADAARAQAARYLTLRRELVARLELEPNVSSIVLMSSVPGDEPVTRYDVDRGDGTTGSAVPAAGASVELTYFETFTIQMLAGRPLDARDLSAGSGTVVVNEAFVHKVLGGGNALGWRIRSSAGRGSKDDAPGPWFEIVGVVPNFPIAVDPSYIKPRIYHPLKPDDTRPLTIAIRARDGNPAAFTTRIRELTASVDPMLRLTQLEPLDASLRDQRMLMESLLLGSSLIALSTLLLSAAGIYALVSLTVTKRRREIAVRLALGAEPGRLLSYILSKALAQIAVGIVVGTAAAIPLNTLDAKGIVVVAALMTVVGAAAAIGPARRGLRIQPTEALKAE